MLPETRNNRFTAKRPLRIALTGYRNHPFGGGQGIFTRYLTKALVNAGHQVDVISGPPYPQLDPRVKLIKIPSLDLYAYPGHHAFALRPRHLRSFTDVYEWWTMLTGGFGEPYTFGRRLTKYLKQHRGEYDLIHDNQTLSYGFLKLQQQGWPVLATFHHPITHDLKIALEAAPWWMKPIIWRWHNFLPMQKKVVRGLKHVVTVSENSRRDIAQDFGVTQDKLSLISIGIDTEEFYRMPDVVREPCRLMATISADQPIKGLRFLLQAVARLVVEFPQLELLVIGQPHEDGITDAMIAKLGISDRVRFETGLTTEALVRRYNEATLQVCPSIYEGFGLPVGEAMSCETPVLATNGGSLPEVVGEAGVLVPVGDVDALVIAIRELLLDPVRRESLGKKGRERILEKFCWNIAAQQYTDYYYRMLDRANG